VPGRGSSSLARPGSVVERDSGGEGEWPADDAGVSAANGISHSLVADSEHAEIRLFQKIAA
jgi:hypothetical protein